MRLALMRDHDAEQLVQRIDHFATAYNKNYQPFK